jgi:CrcB protein
LAIALGGALGAGFRYALFLLFEGTSGLLLFENLLGSFCIGLVVCLLTTQARYQGAWLLPFFVTGMLGSFTSFSGFSFELFQFFEIRNFSGVIFYYSSSLVGGLVAVWAGVVMGQALQKLGFRFWRSPKS